MWYQSLRLGYDKNSSFDSVRLNVLNAAKKMRMTAEEIQIIINAFNTVGIEGKTKAEINGTNVLSGKIVTADLDTTLGNNNSLSGANVTLLRVGTINFDCKVGYTESDGTFCFINIVPGTYKLTVSKSGYVTATQMVTLSSTKLNNYF